MGNDELDADSVFLIDFTFAAQPSGGLRRSSPRIPTKAGTANERMQSRPQPMDRSAVNEVLIPVRKLAYGRCVPR